MAVVNHLTIPQSIDPLEYRILLSVVLNKSIEWVFMHLPNLQLTETQNANLEGLVNRRLKGEPIAKIVGYKEFYGRNFITNSYTLDPRPDSETLIDAVLKNFPKEGAYKILDLGLGTGCLLFTLLYELPLSYGVGIDFSYEALKVAQENQYNLGLETRSICLQGNWANAVSGKFDIIVCNPPYINNAEVLDLSTLHDPHSALFSGKTGLEAYQQIMPQLKSLLNKDGKIFFEIGKGQELCVEKIALDNGLHAEGVFLDLSGTTRVLCYKACL